MKRLGGIRRLAMFVGLVFVMGLLLVPSPAAAAPGDLLWTRQFGSALSDQAAGVAVGADGSVYVVGNTDGPLPGQTGAGATDAYVRKYDAAGNELWSRQFGTGGDDFATGVAVAADGSAYVTGATGGALPGQGSGGGLDAYVRKYNASGTEVWTRQFGTAFLDFGTGLAVAADGSVYVAGATGGALPGQTSAGGVDAYVRKYDATGNALWTHEFGTGDHDFAYGVSVTADGGVSVAGTTGGALPGQSSAGGLDAYVRKYSATGGELWTRQFGTPGSDLGLRLAVDVGGVAYVVGQAGGALPGQTSTAAVDAYVRAYDASGTGLWTRQFGTALFLALHEARGVAVAADGSVYVAGMVAGALPGQTSAGGSDSFLRKYDGTAAPSDTTPPLITPVVTGTLGSNGWYVSAVTVSWNVSDTESSVTSSGCATSTLTSDTIGTTFTCTATSAGGTASASVTIKRDATPPTVACTVTPNKLWPPNHKMVEVNAWVAVSDPISGPAGFTLVSAVSNEPDDGLGDGDMPSDVQGFALGTPDTNGHVRAERSGTGGGRVYTLTYAGMDQTGNSALCSTTISVPDDQGK